VGRKIGAPLLLNALWQNAALLTGSRPVRYCGTMQFLPVHYGRGDESTKSSADCKAAPQCLNLADHEGVQMQASQPETWHGTTILTVRKGGKVVIGGDGQFAVGQTVIKSDARMVRTLGRGGVIGGFAGATADAFTLFERLESKLEPYPAQLTRAAVELAKDWRTDRYLRRLEAMMIVADKKDTLVLTGTGDVLTPDHDVIAIGSG